MSEPNLPDLAKQLADTQTALNLVWTLVAGFLVMFMQAGFALVETGLTRAKNVAHTMAMNLLVYAIGILGFWVCGFALQMGGVGALATLGGDSTLSSELVDPPGRPRASASSGTKGFFLTPASLHARRGHRVPLPDGVHGHRRDDPHGRRGRALEVLSPS